MRNESLVSEKKLFMVTHRLNLPVKKKAGNKLSFDWRKSYLDNETGHDDGDADVVNDRTRQNAVID